MRMTHGVVGLDDDPGVDFGRAGARRLRVRGATPNGSVQAEREPAAGGGGADDELAARRDS